MFFLSLELSLLLLYFYFRVVSPISRLKLPWKILILLAAIGIMGKFTILRFLGGNYFFSCGLPRWFVTGYDVIFSTFLFFLVFLLASDILRLLFALLRCCGISFVQRIKSPWHRSWIFYGIGFLFALSLAICGYYNAVCAMPEIREEKFISPKIREPLRIAVLSDLHFCSRSTVERTREIVRQTNDLNADAIVILGDTVDGHVSEIEEYVSPLRNLRAGKGVYLISGNHEYYSGYHAWMNYFKKLGIRVLDNDDVKIADNVHLFGVCDVQGIRLHEGKIPDWKKIAEAVRASDEKEYKILLSHRPLLGQGENLRDNFDLQLSGHTHGGMAPLLKGLIGLFQRGYISGRYEIGKNTLYVSNGTGLWYSFPVRLFTPAEITLVLLEK